MLLTSGGGPSSCSSLSGVPETSVLRPSAFYLGFWLCHFWNKLWSIWSFIKFWLSLIGLDIVGFIEMLCFRLLEDSLEQDMCFHLWNESNSLAVITSHCSMHGCGKSLTLAADLVLEVDLGYEVEKVSSFKFIWFLFCHIHCPWGLMTKYLSLGPSSVILADFWVSAVHMI